MILYQSLHQFIAIDTSSLFSHLLKTSNPIPMKHTHSLISIPRILRVLCLGGVVTAAALSAASAQVIAYGTAEDFAQFNGATGTTDLFVYSTNNTVNGIGNTTAPGAAGSAGSLVATVASGGYWTHALQDATGTNNLTFPGTTAALFDALSPGSSAGNVLAGSGTISFDLYAADSANMSQQYGIYFNTGAGQYSFTASAGPTFTGADGNTWETFSVPYTIKATTSYFQMQFAQYTQWNAVSGGLLYIDNIAVAANAVPEPSTIALLVMGGLGVVVMIRRRRVEA